MNEFYRRLRNPNLDHLSYDQEDAVLSICELGDFQECIWLRGATARALAEDQQWAILADWLEDHPEEEGTWEDWLESEHGPGPEVKQLREAQDELNQFRWEQHQNQEPELCAFWDRQVRNAEWWLSQLLHPAE